MKNNQLIAFLFGILTLFSSCYSDLPSDNYSILENTTPEDIFKSVFFMNGPLVNHIPSLKSKKDLFESFKINEEANKEIAKAQNQILNEINELNPNYLSNLKESLINNSPYEIKDRIIEGSDLLVKTVHKMGFAEILENQQLKNILLQENIDITKYDLTKDEDIEKLAKDISYLDDTIIKKLQTDANASLSIYSNETNKCAVAAAIAVAAVFLAVGILAAVKVVGVVQDAAFVYEYIHVYSKVASQGGNAGGGGSGQESSPGDAPSGGDQKSNDLQNNLLIADLVLLN